jgi:hypothetical protein
MSAAVQVAPLSPNQWSSVTPLTSVADWYLDSLETVRRLGNMPENWDGFGSPIIPMRVTTAASYMLSMVSLYMLTPPHIAPVPGGGLQLEWDRDNRSLELEVHPSGEMEFLVAEDEEMFVGPVSDKVLPHLLRWLTTGSLT